LVVAVVVVAVVVVAFVVAVGIAIGWGAAMTPVATQRVRVNGIVIRMPATLTPALPRARRHPRRTPRGTAYYSDEHP
jgi:hypothetical protein